MKQLNYLLVLVPVAIVGRFLGWSPTLLFLLSALGVIPLAGLLGHATEELAHHTGPRLGGLLNATLGNAAELIITLFAVRAGLLDLVKASITGSILGNLLLILGLSMLVGGAKHGVQRYDRSQAGINATMLMLSVVMLLVPSLFFFAHTETEGPVEWLSIGVAATMIAIYLLGLVYALWRPSALPEIARAAEQAGSPKLSIRTAALMLIVSTFFIAWLSEILVSAVEHTVAMLGISEFFIGIIVVPLIGNVAEHTVAVQTAWKNKMELSMAVSLGSSLQIAMFVAPALVFISLLMGHRVTLVFNQFELIALFSAVLIGVSAAGDGESNWLEGAMLLGVYIVLALAFFFLPV